MLLSCVVSRGLSHNSVGLTRMALNVIPAKSGDPAIAGQRPTICRIVYWVPAFAGMTGRDEPSCARNAGRYGTAFPVPSNTRHAFTSKAGRGSRGRGVLCSGGSYQRYDIDQPAALVGNFDARENPARRLCAGSRLPAGWRTIRPPPVLLSRPAAPCRSRRRSNVRSIDADEKNRAIGSKSDRFQIFDQVASSPVGERQAEVVVVVVHDVGEGGKAAVVVEAALVDLVGVPQRPQRRGAVAPVR